MEWRTAARIPLDRIVGVGGVGGVGAIVGG